MVIHRAILGSVERFFALLLEHTGGALPVWIAPVQAVLIPIADRHQAQAAELAAALRSQGFRISVDDRREKMGYKIREAEVRRVPFMVVLGDREVEEGTVAVRTRGRRGQQTMTAAALGERLDELTRNRSLTP